MSLRETINKNPMPWLAGIGLIVVGVLAYFVFLSGGHQSGVVQPSYYSTDNGATYFVDESQPAPFTKDGTEAVRAVVARDRETGEEFVAYLTKFKSEEDRQKAIEVEETGARIGVPPMLYKKPGDSEWVDAAVEANAEKVAAIKKIVAPSGGSFSIVVPD